MNLYEAGQEPMELEEILQTAADNDASDIHIVPGHPPVMRVHTVMTPMDFPVLTPETSRKFLEKMAAAPTLKIFDSNQDGQWRPTFSFQEHEFNDCVQKLNCTRPATFQPAPS